MLALVATRLMASLLFGVRTTDPLPFVATATKLLVVTAVASFIPAHRAASLNLVKALHYE